MAHVHERYRVGASWADTVKSYELARTAAPWAADDAALREAGRMVDGMRDARMRRRTYNPITQAGSPPRPSKQRPGQSASGARRPRAGRRGYDIITNRDPGGEPSMPEDRRRPRPPPPTFSTVLQRHTVAEAEAELRAEEERGRRKSRAPARAYCIVSNELCSVARKRQ